jgi:hypothetical protein
MRCNSCWSGCGWFVCVGWGICGLGLGEGEGGGRGAAVTQGGRGEGRVVAICIKEKGWYFKVINFIRRIFF